MLKKLRKEILLPRNFKSSESDYKLMQLKADKYTGGNFSEWIRYASLTHEPRPEELDDDLPIEPRVIGAEPLEILDLKEIIIARNETIATLNLELDQAYLRVKFSEDRFTQLKQKLNQLLSENN